ncbi:MAG TPA: CocE/NonD family hydrolase [Desulfobulbus sp.]|nr:CocE/NonD family hydrolase [Desulfobulbus sp.]
MKELPIVLILLLIAVVVALPAVAAERQIVVRPSMDGVRIPLRDGKALAADIYLPQRQGKFPTILIITPYNRKLMGAALPDPKLKGTLFFDREEYAIAIVDWRGFFGSKDARSSGAKPGKDGYDVVEWIAAQPWSNGRVGMWGPSALGKIQFYTAIENPPHLVCGVPMVSEFGYSYGQFFHGGVLKKAYVDTVTRVGFNLDRVKSHPTDDRFWKAVAEMKQTSRIDIPLLLISGWYDLYTDGVLSTWRDIRTNGGPRARENVRLLIGPWDHSHTGKLKQGDLEFPNAEGYDLVEARRFFDYWLRDRKDNGWQERPRILYYLLGADTWQGLASWPQQPDIEYACYLSNGGTLTDRLESIAPLKECYLYDPSNPSPTIGGMTVYKFWDPTAPKVSSGPKDQRPVMQGRSDYLLFTGKVLDAPREVRGNPLVDLFISSDRVDTDFAVRLCDIYPDGRYILVTDGIQRVSLRMDGARPEYITPGNIYRLTVKLSVTAWSFQKGHRIGIIITSSNYPRFAVNPNLDRPRLFATSRLFVARNCVWSDSGNPSALRLPDFSEAGRPAGGPPATVKRFLAN